MPGNCACGVDASQHAETIHPFRNSRGQIFSLAGPGARHRVPSARPRIPKLLTARPSLGFFQTLLPPFGEEPICRSPAASAIPRKREYKKVVFAGGTVSERPLSLPWLELDRSGKELRVGPECRGGGGQRLDVLPSAGYRNKES